MEKWLVILGIWAMCATCAVLFIRGATSSTEKRLLAEGRPRRASRASGDKAQAGLQD